MEVALDIVSWILLVAGGLICIIAGIGLNRFPDVYARIHAAGMTDTLGAALVLGGLLLQAPSGWIGVKLVMIALFLWISTPTSTHALAQSAHAHGIEPVLGDAPNPLKGQREPEEEV